LLGDSSFFCSSQLWNLLRNLRVTSEKGARRRERRASETEEEKLARCSKRNEQDRARRRV
jgi:hypothetical protein